MGALLIFPMVWFCRFPPERCLPPRFFMLPMCLPIKPTPFWLMEMAGHTASGFLVALPRQTIFSLRFREWALFPALPFNFQEIPLSAEIDLVGQRYTLTPNQLSYHGNYGTADVELTQSD